MPTYDRAQVQTGILHVGVGHFHKAHQAVFTDDVLHTGDRRWGIRGVSTRSLRAEQQLAPQDGLFTAVSLSPKGADARIVGAIQDVLTTTTEAGYQRFLEAFAASTTHVVTITATEKGYCATANGLNPDHPDVRHDLTTTGAKTSLPGLLIEGIAHRSKPGNGPITLISCDNILDNGRTLKRVVNDYASVSAPELLGWIERNVTFPNTMVDRITPATSDQDRRRWTQELGYRDEGLVCCEPYSQWVIENRFAGPRPPWEEAGVFVVDDVKPYEQAKLRLLNAPHSACAYLGLLAGYDFVHEVVQDSALGQFIRLLASEEIAPTVNPPRNLDLDRYCAQVFERFANSAVPYRTRQVGTDGSLKLPQRLVPVVRERIAKGQPISKLACVFAAWLEHLSDPAPDPLGATLASLHQKHGEPRKLIKAVFEDTPVLDGLGEHRGAFTTVVAHAIRAIREMGLRGALSQAFSVPK